jgi:hypothetical protein
MCAWYNIETAKFATFEKWHYIEIGIMLWQKWQRDGLVDL